MRLKVATTTALLFGLALLGAWPWAVGPRPAPGSPDRAVAEYGLRVLAYFGLTCFAFLTAAVLALILARRTREAYREQLRQNLDELVEGTLRDHARGREPDGTSDRGGG